MDGLERLFVPADSDKGVVTPGACSAPGCAGEVGQLPGGSLVHGDQVNGVSVFGSDKGVRQVNGEQIAQ